MTTEHLHTLAAEYLELVRLMTSGQYDRADYARLSADRTNVHDTLIRVLGPGHERPFDMAAHCRALLDAAPSRL